MKGKKIFVSGGAGVIGSELVPQLIELGAEVMVGDLKSRPNNFPKQVLYKVGDLNYITKSEIEAFGPEIFIHLAATFERSEESYDFWDMNFWNNVRLSNHLMTVVKDCSTIKRVVFASSYLIYNKKLYQFNSPKVNPISLSEDDEIDPRNLTGSAKLNHEIELNFLSGHRSELSIALARIYRGYGKNSRDIISRWVRALLKNEEISIYRPEGIFDYIYAADSAKGLIKLAENYGAKGTYNLGTGKAKSVNEVLNTLIDIFPSAKFKYVNSSIPYEASQANMNKFYSDLSWLPEYSIKEGIDEIVRYETNKASNKNITIKPIEVENILITSSSSKVALVKEVRRALIKINPKGRIFAGDSNQEALTANFVEDFWHMPKTTDENMEEILSWCLEKNIDVIIPTRDGELVFWANNKQKFLEKGIHILVSKTESIDLCLDKLKFFKHGKKNNYKFINTSRDIQDIDEKAFVVKENHGSGSKNILLNATKKQSLNFSSNLNEPIFQPFIEGYEISIDAWCNKEYKVKGLILRYRTKVKSGESIITETFRNENFENALSGYIESLELNGHIVMQAIVSKKDELYVIECNPRFGGASTASIRAGLDSFFWSFVEILEGTVEDYLFHRSIKEVKQIKFAENEFI